MGPVVWRCERDRAFFLAHGMYGNRMYDMIHPGRDGTGVAF